MAEILSFPNSVSYKAAGFSHFASSHDMLNPKTRTRVRNDDRVPASGRDWTNQELADLYRVEGLLIQARIGIETTRGVSDEGDPWFVFCRADGEVFAHFSRIDGSYVLDGPKLDKVLRGASFTELIDHFASVVAARSPVGNLVRLHTNDPVVRLHPAVMLAALVWSLFLASDHLGSAHASELENSDDGETPLFPSVHEHEPVGKILSRAESKMTVDDLHRLPARALDVSRTGPASDGVGSFFGMNAVAASLTAVAISFGLFESNVPDYADDASEPLAASTFTPSEEVHAASLQSQVPADDVTKVVSKDTTLPDNDVSAKIVAVLTPLHLTAEHAPDAQDVLKAGDAAQASAAGKAAMLQSTEDVPVSAQAESSPPQGAGTTKVATATDDYHDLQSLISVAVQYLGAVSTYNLADTKVDATFDVSILNTQAAQLVLGDLWEKPEDMNEVGVPSATSSVGYQGPESPAAGETSHYLPYDDAAKNFVYQFLLKSNSIEMVQSENKVVFVDTTAIDPDDDTYSMSWMSDDHFIVSTIGHAQDFTDYLLA